MSKHRERILDLALEEELAGTTPPDLSEQIRWRLAANEHRRSQIALVRSSPRSLLGSWFGRVAGAAAALAVIFFTANPRVAQPRAALFFGRRGQPAMALG